MQAALYRKLNEVVDGFRTAASPRTDTWVRKLFEALDWGGRAAFSIKPETGGFSLEVDNCRVINVAVQSPDHEEAVYSALNRAYNQDVAWVIATDFKSLGVFGSYWVSFQHNVESALAFKISYPEFLVEAPKFDLLTPQEVAKNRLDEFYTAIPGRKRRHPIDVHLVEQMGKWRRLALDSLQQPNMTDDPLIYRLINALFLVRYMEDSNLLPSRLESLTKESSNTKCSEQLKSVLKFVKERTGYKVPTNRELDRLDLTPIRSLINQLYGYQDWGVRYDFAAMSVDILGRFYEEYLQLGLTQPVQVSKKTQEQYLFPPTYELKDMRRQRGIFYTPRYIVDYIVNNLIDRYEANNSTDPPAVADLACGSGTFLVSTADALSKRKKWANQLVDVIYGLDIDERAIEAARLNLTAKLLTKQVDQPLPELKLFRYDLIGQGPQGDQLIKEFPPEGVDIVVGNPPFIHYEKLSESHDPKIIQKNFETASQRVDAYILFVEAALKVVRKGGLCGLVLPNSFLRATTAVPLRKWLSEHADILEVIDYLDQPVFQGVGIYVCLLLFRKRDPEIQRPQATVARIYRLSSTPSDQLAKISVSSDEAEGHEVFNINQPTSGSPWVLRNPTDEKLLKQIQSGSESFGKAVEIRQGVKTGADSVFVIDKTPGNLEVSLLEEPLLIPFLRNKETRRWHSNPTTYLIFPYDREKRKPLDWRTLEKKYPRIAGYLLSHKESLQKRKSLRGKQWFELIEPRLPSVCSNSPKLFIAELSLRPIVCKTSSQVAAIAGSTGGGSWLVLSEGSYDIMSLMAYLNSVVAEWYFRQVSSLRRGGWLLLEQHLIQNLPLPAFLRDSNSFARVQISRLAEQLASKAFGNLGGMGIDTRREVRAIEEQIDSLIIEALGLNASQGEYIRSRAVGLRGASKDQSESEQVIV